MNIKVLSREKNFTGSEYKFTFDVTDPLSSFTGSVYIRSVEFEAHKSLNDLGDEEIVEAIISHLERVVAFFHADTWR
jgi:hypothetical protein